MHTINQLVDFLNAHGAPRELLDQVRSLQFRHALNASSFQDVCNRLHWQPRGIRVGDAANWVRQGIRN